MARWGVFLGLVITLSSGCAGGRESKAALMALGAASSGGGQAAPGAAGPPAIGAMLADPEEIAFGPPDRAWYFQGDSSATPDNEAARDLARAMASSNGLTEAFLYGHLTSGGGLAIFVGGAGHEQDSPAHRSGWTRPYAAYVQGVVGLPVIQVDYLNWAAGSDFKALLTFHWSQREGVERTDALVGKAIEAGAGEIRLFSHSKGGDIAQEVCWLRRNEPRLTQTVALGVPFWSAAVPDEVPGTRAGGLFRYDVHKGRDWGGKLVLFVRYSDRISHGNFIPPQGLPGPGHDYEKVLATSGFCALLDAARFAWPRGSEDRALGIAYDY